MYTYSSQSWESPSQDTDSPWLKLRFSAPRGRALAAAELRSHPPLSPCFRPCLHLEPRTRGLSRCWPHLPPSGSQHSSPQQFVDLRTSLSRREYVPEIREKPRARSRCAHHRI